MKFNKLNFKKSCKSISSLEGTWRFNISLRHVPATFSCVCTCCDFVPASCPRYTSLLDVASVCTTQFFFCGCNMTPRICPLLVTDECTPTLCEEFLTCLELKKISRTKVETLISYLIWAEKVSQSQSPKTNEKFLTRFLGYYSHLLELKV